MHAVHSILGDFVSFHIDQCSVRMRSVKTEKYILADCSSSQQHKEPEVSRPSTYNQNQMFSSNTVSFN